MASRLYLGKKKKTASGGGVSCLVRVAIEGITVEPVIAKIPLGAEATQHVVARVYRYPPSSVPASKQDGSWDSSIKNVFAGFMSS